VEVGRPPKAAQCKGLQNVKKGNILNENNLIFVLKKFKLLSQTKGN
jgi:hypothetical protein